MALEMNARLEDWLARLEVRRCAERYALAVDSGDTDLFVSQFTTDGALSATNATHRGSAELRAVVHALQARFDATFHAVLNQTSEIVGETATAQTYCVARHYYRDRTEAPVCFEMTIRYHDEFARVDGAWLFSRRRLEVVATQKFPVDAAAPRG